MNYAGSLTYIGSHTRKIIKCFNKYGLGIAIKKCETVFDKIRNKNIEKIPVLQKSGIYKLKCKDCNKVYLGETGRKFVCRLSDHKCGEGNRTTNSLYARHFIEDNHKFGNPLEDYEIVKIVERNPVSYTHLDVYKRQIYASVGGRTCSHLVDHNEYTHNIDSLMKDEQNV